MPKVSTKKEEVPAVKRVVRKPRAKKESVMDIDSVLLSTKTKKKISLSDLKPISIKNKTRKTKVSKIDDVVILPEKVDSKLLEKVSFYTDVLYKKTPKIMRVVANVGGYTFIVVGLYLCFVIADIKESKVDNLLALTTCVDISCDQTIQTTTTNPIITDTTNTTTLLTDTKDTILLVPKVLFSSDFPREPENDFLIKVEAQNASEVKVFLTSDSSSIVIDLVNKGDNAFFVPVSTLKPATYTFRAKVLASDNLTKYYFSGDKFIIKPSLIDTNTATTTENNTTPVVTADKTLATTTVVEEKVVSEQPKPTLEVHKLSELNQFRFLVKNIPDSRFVEFYVKPKLSNDVRFVGLGQKRDNIWVFNLNGNELPVGNYEIFFKAPISGKIFKSEVAFFSIAKQIIQTQPKNVETEDSLADPVILSEKVKRVFEEKSDAESASSTTDYSSLLERRKVYFEASDADSLSKISSQEADTSEQNSNIKTETADLLNKDKEKLNRLLKRYASALQGDDENLKRLANSEITKFRDSLVTESAIDKKTKDISASIAVELDKEIDRLQRKVEKYESLITERSELVGKDTDNDGITDFDEVNLYSTNATLPDTDSDGVLDGIEIMRGYNPNDADLEAIINFHSPKDVNFIDEENMKIESVTPVIETDTNQGGVPVLAEIKGKGLPNSFVTLFIYSSPTVVSVKTDNNGDFVYTFTKELEDGDHEVYVAVTDNKGEIVARSNPFQFVKTAEAFTPVDAKSNNTVNYSQEYYKDTELSSYNIVAGMGVVSFGLILLMLGYTLRGRSEKILEEEK